VGRKREKRGKEGSGLLRGKEKKGIGEIYLVHGGGGGEENYSITPSVEREEEKKGLPSQKGGEKRKKGQRGGEKKQPKGIFPSLHREEKKKEDKKPIFTSPTSPRERKRKSS